MTPSTRAAKTATGRPATDPAGPTGRLATWVAKTTLADIREKYAKLTDRIITADRQAAIEKAVLGIDTLDDVAQLTALLTPTVHSPLD
jgi:hypothetical protein